MSARREQIDRTSISLSDELSRFIIDTPGADYQEYLDGVVGPFAALRLRRCESNGDCFLHRSNGNVTGLIKLCPLEWDSDVLGVQVARIEQIISVDARATEEALINGLTQADHRGTGLVTARIRSNDYATLHILESAGFRTVDSMNIYLTHRDEMPSDENGNGDSGVEFLPLSAATEDERIRLAEIAASSFVGTRIGNDPRISEEARSRFYVRMTGSLLNDAEATVFARIDGKVAGFAVGAKDAVASDALGTSLGYLWLIAVDDKFAGQGLGHRLFAAFRQEFHHYNEWLEVGTQIHNTAALNIYSRARLRHVSSLVTLHRWAAS